MRINFIIYFITKSVQVVPNLTPFSITNIVSHLCWLVERAETVELGLRQLNPPVEVDQGLADPPGSARLGSALQLTDVQLDILIHRVIVELAARNKLPLEERVVSLMVAGRLDLMADFISSMGKPKRLVVGSNQPSEYDLNLLHFQLN